MPRGSNAPAEPSSSNCLLAPLERRHHPVPALAGLETFAFVILDANNFQEVIRNADQMVAKRRVSAHLLQSALDDFLPQAIEQCPARGGVGRVEAQPDKQLV